MWWYVCLKKDCRIVTVGKMQFGLMPQKKELMLYFISKRL